MAYKIMSNVLLQRLIDGAFIPVEPGNKDYREYQRWLAQGNTPTPADPPPPPDTRRQTALQALQDVIDDVDGSPKVKQMAQALKAIL
jgi:hypothetical protein